MRGVDREIEFVGEKMRDAICALLRNEHDRDYDNPADVRRVFEAIYADLCVSFGWYEDADGRWWRSPVKGWLE